MGILSSLFSLTSNEEDIQKKADRKKFDILKYDGIRAQRIGRFDYAMKCYTEALKIEKDFETMKYLVSVFNTLNMHDRALETLNEMVATEEEPVNSLLMRANILVTMEKYAESAADCLNVIQLEPDNCFAYFQLAKAELASGETNSALEHLYKATALKDDFVEAYTLRANVNLTMNSKDKALIDIGKLIELTPEDESAYLLRGGLYESINDTDAALNDYRQALELNPFNETAYLQIGALLMKLEKYDDAIELFDEAIENIETSAKAYAARALVKRKTGDNKGASADEEKAKEINPEENINPDGNNFDNLYSGNII